MSKYLEFEKTNNFFSTRMNVQYKDRDAITKHIVEIVSNRGALISSFDIEFLNIFSDNFDLYVSEDMKHYDNCHFISVKNFGIIGYIHEVEDNRIEPEFIIGELLAISRQIDEIQNFPCNKRTPNDVLCSVMEEVGELSTEVRVKYGTSYKEGDKDGILGEGCDAILCILDLIYVDNPDISSEKIIEILKFKSSKWLAKESGQKWDNNYKVENDG